jgi:hypothetical protein
MVFRPASFSFPRSRGRTSFELLSGGKLVDHGFGAGDATTETRGTWEQQPDGTLALYHDDSKEPDRVLKIVKAERDRLVVQMAD